MMNWDDQKCLKPCMIPVFRINYFIRDSSGDPMNNQLQEKTHEKCSVYSFLLKLARVSSSVSMSARVQTRPSRCSNYTGEE